MTLGERQERCCYPDNEDEEVLIRLLDSPLPHGSIESIGLGEAKGSMQLLKDSRGWVSLILSPSNSRLEATMICIEKVKVGRIVVSKEK
jgi:hypothetical protein